MGNSGRCWDPSTCFAPSNACVDYLLSLAQLKEMVLALLHESDLVLSDDVVETIVEKVHISLFLLASLCYCFASLKTNSH